LLDAMSLLPYLWGSEWLFLRLSDLQKHQETGGGRNLTRFVKWSTFQGITLALEAAENGGLFLLARFGFSTGKTRLKGRQLAPAARLLPSIRFGGC
jgi:hypothetical protein